MNILIIPSWYSSEKSPNRGAFFREQALALKKQGHNIIILNATFVHKEDINNKNNFKLRVEQDEGMIVYSYNIPSLGISKFKSVYINLFYKIVEYLYRKIENDGIAIDIIHAHSSIPAGYSACKIGKKYNIPVVVTEHSSGVLNKNLYKYELDCLNYIVNESDGFICVSEALKKSILEMIETEKDILVIPNLVSDIFSITKNNNNKDVFKFFSLGNLVESKRFDLVINAFTKAFRNNKNVELYIGGKGVLSSELNNLINTNCMNEQIKLLGELDRKDVARIMEECDSFVLASEYETFGVVYIEAMACGKPIVTTKNGGSEKIIDQSNGILINKNNMEELESALKYMYKNIEMYDSYKISKKCKDMYGSEVIANKIIKLYKKIIFNKEKDRR